MMGVVFVKIPQRVAKESIVLRIQVLQRGNFRQTIERFIAKEGFGKESRQQYFNQRRLKDESQWNPREKSLQRLQRDF